MDPKPMIYGYNPKMTEEESLLYKEVYRGMLLVVINTNGSHPCGYVEVTGTKYDEHEEWNALSKDDKKYFYRQDRPKCRLAYDLDVYGGISFSNGYCIGIHHIDKDTWNTSRWFIGWDYDHISDYSCKPDRINMGVMHSTEEVIKDAKHLIDQILDDKT